MLTKSFQRVFFLSTAFAATSVCAQATLNTNLILNGDAESGLGGNGETIIAAPNFTSSSNFTVVIYGASGGFPLATSPGSASRGANFFAGGQSTPSSGATQLIDVSSLISPIDQGLVTFDLSAYLGGYNNHRDYATLAAKFISASNSLLGSASVGPITNAARGNSTGLLFTETGGSIPVGTRSVDIILTMTRFDGSYNDGFADNLSLVLSAVPEPSSFALFAAGLVALLIPKAHQRKRTDA